MRRVLLALCVVACGSSVFAAPQKPELSIDFSQAAMKYLMVVSNYESAAVYSPSKAQDRINAAYASMVWAATGGQTSPDNLTTLLLKIFAITHMMNVKTYKLSGDRREVTKDETCISEWKQALLSRSSDQPETCR
jgi:hypothetical protein